MNIDGPSTNELLWDLIYLYIIWTIYRWFTMIYLLFTWWLSSSPSSESRCRYPNAERANRHHPHSRPSPETRETRRWQEPGWEPLEICRNNMENMGKYWNILGKYGKILENHNCWYRFTLVYRHMANDIVNVPFASICYSYVSVLEGNLNQQLRLFLPKSVQIQGAMPMQNWSLVRWNLYSGSKIFSHARRMLGSTCCDVNICDRRTGGSMVARLYT